MTHPDVDVLVPTVHRPELLRAAVASAVAQDYPGVVRVLVHYDGDDPQVDDSLRSDDPRRPVTVMTAPPGRSGAAAARNTMMRVTSSPVVALLDDDDTWTPDKLAKQVGVLDAEPETEVVMSGSLVHGLDTSVRRIPPDDRITLLDLVRSRVNAAHFSSLVVRRSALDEIGLLDEDIPGSYGEDRDWLIRAARRRPIRVVTEPLVHVTAQRQSLFAGRWDTIIAAIDHLVAKHPELREDHVGHARMLGRRAFANGARGDHAAARRDAVQALRTNVRDRRAWVALAVGARIVPARLLLRLANVAGRGI